MYLAALFSGGKDSTIALHTAAEEHEIAVLISMHSSNRDSWMFHTPNVKLTGLQAEALQLPLIEAKTKGAKEEELKDLKKAIESAIDKYSIEGVVSGALFSNYQKSRIDKLCDDLEISSISPLWHTKIGEYMQCVASQYEVIITHVAADGFDRSWLGRKIDHACLEDLERLNRKFNINIAGEGGEYETLVCDSPMFKKRLQVSGRVEWQKSSGSYFIEKAKLIKK